MTAAPGEITHNVLDQLEAYVGEWFGLVELETVMGRYHSRAVRRAVVELVNRGLVERRVVDRPGEAFGHPGVWGVVQVRAVGRSETCRLRSVVCRLCGVKDRRRRRG